jgi:glucans biosynthesis protein
LIQRKRALTDFEDLEAHYERRPSAWVEPVGGWGSGTLHLVEIPSEEEIDDNIVAFWRPSSPLVKEQVYSFGYHITWSHDVSLPSEEAVVSRTLSGLANGQERKTGSIRYAVDFTGSSLKSSQELPQVALTASSGRVSTPVVLRNPGTGGIRVDFLLTPGDAEVVELRLELQKDGKTVSEVWLSRWIRS